MFMMKKVTLLFAALMITIGVSAQTTYEYFEFPEEVSEKVEITSADEFENLDGEWIVIQHNHDVTNLSHQGHYFIINSAIPDGQSYHTTAMNERCSGLAMFQLEKVTDSNGNIGYQLKTIHSRTEGKTCYLGQFGGTYLNTTNTQNSNPAIVNFARAEQGFMISSSCSKGEYCMYVEQDAEGVPQMTTKSVTDGGTDFVEHTVFKVYKVTATHGTIKKVENARVVLTGQGGNNIEGTHTGWSDFYEFVTNGDAYGCTLSNAHYDEESNTITGDIDFPFAVTGNYVQVPVYLHARKDPYKRVSIVNGTLKVVDNEEGDENKNSQWYIIPKIEGLKITYALKNVGTGEYIYKSGTSTIGLSSQDATYFGLDANAGKDAVRFFFAVNATSDYYLAANTDGTMTSGYKWGNPAYNFIVETVSSDNVDFGIQQRYPLGTAFWNAGIVTEENQPTAIRAMVSDLTHEFYESEHEVYSAETAITVKSRSDVVVTFNYTNGNHLLNIYGIDIVSEDGTVVLFDYHLGKAGASNKTSKNVYTLKNVPLGDWKLRYFVCNTPELTEAEGHFLGNNAGYIQVDGASFKLKISDAPTADWAHNTTWYYMLSKDANGTVCAEPAYTDWHNNLKVNNATASKSAAGLWAIVGNDTDGYKFYNRAWGTGYALKTTGANGEARSFMTTANDASLYDIVRHEDGAIYVKVRGEVANNYLNNNNGYLGTWTDGSSLGDTGSRIYLNEVLNTAEFDAGVEPIVATLKKEWAPWTGENANPDINTAYNNNSTFASWVLGRQQLAELLNGKVFKFANKGTDARSGRALGVIEVDSQKHMGGIAPKNDGEKYIDEFLQLLNNNDGTYKLLHIGTNKYFQNPSSQTITENVADAANYTFEIYQNEVQSVHFVSGSEHMHLGEDGNSFKILSWGGIDDLNSRWNIIYDADAQALADLIAQAKDRYTATQETTYQANVGVPGYANDESTTALLNTFNGGLVGMTFAKATTALTNAMNGVSEAEKAVFFPTNCYFTITNREHSLVYAKNDAIDETHNSEFIWTTTSVDATNPNHLWGFYQDVETGDYYLYNVGKVQFANSKGKGNYWDTTWILSNNPVAITMEAMDTPYFHIKGDGKTMSVSTGYVGPVITYYADGHGGVPMQFNKSTVSVDPKILEQLKNLGIVDFAPGFYTLKYNNLYLNDTRLGGNNLDGDGRRTLTEMTADKIDYIFYYTPNKEMVGYKSGYGFTYGYCNTGKPEDGYNTFTFKTSSEPGKYLIKSETGGSTLGWGDRYLLVDGENQFTATNDWNKKLAAAWTIEAVTELPVKLTTAKNLTEGGAYGTIWCPVALEIPKGVTAYTGYVTSECVLVLEAITGGVIPAETGVVLWNPDATETYTQNLKITEAEATGVSNDNKFVGWVMTKVNPNTVDGDYYSLTKKNERMAFYRYVGKNLQGFRARIQKSDAPQGANALTIRFNTTTGIEEVLSAFQNGTAYDLSGRRVATPEKGLYIVNGRKVFIK